MGQYKKGSIASEIKLEVLSALEAGTSGITEICKKYGISKISIYNWIKEKQEGRLTSLANDRGTAKVSSEIKSKEGESSEFSIKDARRKNLFGSSANQSDRFLELSVNESGGPRTESHYRSEGNLYGF